MINSILDRQQMTSEEYNETICSLAAMMLYDDELEITATNIAKVIKMSGNVTEPYWPALFSNALNEAGVGSLLANVKISRMPLSQSELFDISHKSKVELMAGYPALPLTNPGILITSTKTLDQASFLPLKQVNVKCDILDSIATFKIS